MERIPRCCDSAARNPVLSATGPPRKRSNQRTRNKAQTAPPGWQEDAFLSRVVGSMGSNLSYELCAGAKGLDFSEPCCCQHLSDVVPMMFQYLAGTTTPVAAIVRT